MGLPTIPEAAQKSECNNQNELEKRVLDALWLLENEQSRLSGLTQLKVCFNDTGLGQSYIMFYLKISRECKELFSVLNTGSKLQAHELKIMWNLLETILLTTSQEQGLHTCGMLVMQRLLHEHSKKLYSSLGELSPKPLVQSALKLLTAMLAQGPVAVMEVLNTFNFSLKGLEGISKVKAQKDGTDVRTAFIHWFLAFYIFGDLKCIRQVLGIKVFLQEVIRSLPFISSSTIILVLSTLREKVIHDELLLKKTKILFFTGHVLGELSKLCTFGDENESSDLQVRKLAGDILNELCGTRSIGIGFPCKDGALSGRTSNPVLFKFLMGIQGRAFEDDMLAQVTIRTLTAHHDLILPYIRSLSLAPEPRPSDKWMQSFVFLEKVWSGIPNPEALLVSSERQLTHTNMAIFTRCLAPDCVSRGTLIKGLKHPSPMVKLLTLKLILVIAKRAVNARETVASDKSSSTVSSLLASLDVQLIQILPESTFLVAIRQKCASRESKDTDPSEEPEELLEGRNSAENKRNPINLEILTTVLDILCYYASIWPTLFIESGFNCCKLMVFDDFQMFLDETTLQETTLRLLHNLPAQSLKWNVKKETYHMKIFYKLLQLYCTSTVSKIQKLCTNLILKLLKWTGMFDNHLLECFVWLTDLKSMSGENSGELVGFFNDVCLGVCQDQLTILDELADIASKVDEDQVLSRDSRYPFSPLVVGCLKNMHALKEQGKLQNDGSIVTYVSGVLSKLIVCLPALRPLAQYLLPQLDLLIGSESMMVTGQSRLYALSSYCVDWCKAMGLKRILKNVKLHRDQEGSIQTSWWKGQQISRFMDSFGDYFPINKRRLQNLATHSTLSLADQFHFDSKFALELEMNCRVKLFCSLHHYMSRTKLKGSCKNVITLFSDDFRTFVEHICDNQLSSCDPMVLKDKSMSYWTFVTIFSQSTVRLILFSDNHVEESFTSVLWNILKFLLERDTEIRRTSLAIKLFSSMTDWIIKDIQSADSEAGNESFSGMSCFRLFGNYFPPDRKERVLQELLNSTEQLLKAVSPLQDRLKAVSLLLHVFQIPDNDVGIFFERETALSTHMIKLLFEQNICLKLTNRDLVASLVKHGSGSLRRFLSPKASESLFHESETYALPLQQLCRVSPVHRVTIVKMLGSVETQIWPLSKEFIAILEPLLFSRDRFVYLKEIGEFIFNTNYEQLISVLCSCFVVGNDFQEVSCQILQEIINISSDDENARYLVSKVISSKYKTDSAARYALQVVRTFCRKIGANGLEKEVLHFLVARWSSAIRANRGDEEAIITGILEDTLKRSQSEDACLTESDMTDAAFITDIEKCWKTVLSHRLANASAIQSLRCLTGLCYANEDFSGRTQLPSNTLYEMIIGHSKFTDVIDCKDFDPEARDAIFGLLLSIAKQSPDVCSTSHLPAFLMAYGGSLSQTDQTISKLLRLYEDHGSFLEAKLFLWGPGALDFYRGQKDQPQTLWSKPGFQDVIEQLQSDRLLQSAIKFPLTRTLLVTDPANDVAATEELYDPAFLLPLFNNLLDAGVEIDCRKFAYNCCLAFVIGSLSSLVESVRALGYHLLMKFQQQMELARFKEKNQVECVLKHLKFSVTERNQRVTSCLCNWFIQVLQLMMRPEQHLYPMMNGFFLSHYTMQLKDVPLFFPLFNSSTLKFPTERAWILRLLASSFKHQSDYHTVKRQHVFPLIMSFHDSSFSDLATRKLVLDILSHATKMPNAAYDLVKCFGLMSWLSSKCRINTLSQHLALSVMEILENLLKSFDIGGVSDVPYPPNFLFENYLICLSVASADRAMISPLVCRKLLHVLAATISAIPEHDLGVFQMSLSQFDFIIRVLHGCCDLSRCRRDDDSECDGRGFPMRCLAKNHTDLEPQLLISMLQIADFFFSKRLSELSYTCTFICPISTFTFPDDDPSIPMSLQMEHSSPNNSVEDRERLITIYGDLILTVALQVQDSSVITGTISILRALRELLEMKNVLIFSAADFYLFKSLCTLLVSMQYSSPKISDKTLRLQDGKTDVEALTLLSLLTRIISYIVGLIVQTPKGTVMVAEFDGIKSIVTKKKFKKEMMNDDFRSDMDSLLGDKNEAVPRMGLAYILQSAFLDDILTRNNAPEIYLHMRELTGSKDSPNVVGVKKKKTTKRKLSSCANSRHAKKRTPSS